MACIVCKQNFGYERQEWVTNVYYYPTQDEKVTGSICYKCCTGKLASCRKCNDANRRYNYYPRTVMGVNKFRDDGNLYCSIHQNFNPAEKAILSYGSKADSYIGFIGSPQDSLYMGVELEVESHSAVKDKDLIWDLFDNFIIMKTDGSLTSQGIEIVSAPAPFEVHMTAWNKFLDNLPKGLCSSTHVNGNDTTCGMHIHVSKKAFTALEIGKAAYFINHPKYRKLVTDICGRYNNPYCKIEPLSPTNLSKYSSSDKYHAVNTRNNNTVEFRIFKGELNKILFLKNIEFIHALCKFVRNTDVVDLTESNFISYVVDKKVIYTNLHKFLVQYGYAPGVKQPANLFKSI